MIVRCASTDDVVAAVNFGREHDLVVRGARREPLHPRLQHVRRRHRDRPRSDEPRGGRPRGAHRAGRRVAQPGATWTPPRRSTGSPSPAAGSPTRASAASRPAAAAAGWSGCTASPARACSPPRWSTADGSVVRASADENPELFWGLRGGGGNFGAVTEFEFRLHPVGPIVMGGMLVYPRERAKEVLRIYRDFIETGTGRGRWRCGSDHRPARGVRSRGSCADSRRWGSCSSTWARSRTARQAARQLREATESRDRHGSAHAVRRAAADARCREPARSARVLQGRLGERDARRGDRPRSSSRRRSCRHRSDS